MKALLPILLLATACSLDTATNVDEPRPEGSATVVMQFCDQAPSWFAYKNEGHDWILRQVFSGQREFAFPATERVTVVTGFGFSSLSFAFSEVVVRNLTRDEANAFRCRLTPLGVSQMTGLVQTENEDLTVIQLGDAVDFTEGNQSFVMSRLGPGALDLVAVNRLFDTLAVPRVIVRSNITVAHNAAIPMLDFAGPEARPLGIVKVRHDGGTAGTGFVQFETARKSRVPLTALGSFGADDTLRLAVIPPFFIATGDLHRFDIHSGDRGVTYWQPQPVDTSITFGPAIGALTVDTIASQVLRPRVRFASQSEYPTMAEALFLQTSSTASRSIQVITSAAYLGGTPAQWEVSLPDLRAIIPNAWVLTAGPATTTRVTVRDARPALYHGVDTPIPGEKMRYASKLAP